MVFRGGWLLLLLMLGLTISDLGWISFLHEEGPAFRVSGTQRTQILLTTIGSRLDGIHQINDAQQLIDVIDLAGLRMPDNVRQVIQEERAFQSGKMIIFHVVSDAVVALEFGWMPAAMRISLGIPLNVNHMSGADWEDLPGVGPTLALSIDVDRHKNGDFQSIYALERVSGVGVKRIERWKSYFENH